MCSIPPAGICLLKQRTNKLFVYTLCHCAVDLKQVTSAHEMEFKEFKLQRVTSLYAHICFYCDDVHRCRHDSKRSRKVKKWLQIAGRV